MKKIILGLGAAILIVLTGLAVVRFFSGPEDAWICTDDGWAKHGNPAGARPSAPCADKTQSPEIIPEKETIRVFSPTSGATVKSPLTISGEASGWYFEGVFPIELVDAEGKVLASGNVTAGGDWMTTDFVPFSGKLEFKAGKAKQGTLIFKKDNPSGLPENDASLRVPVKFGE